jgi:hypothetical protein
LAQVDQVVALLPQVQLVATLTFHPLVMAQEALPVLAVEAVLVVA